MTRSDPAPISPDPGVDTPSPGIFLLIVAIEIAVIAGLYWFGRHFV